MKNKRGYTLIEMILVVGIITILSGVVVVGISSSIDRYEETAMRDAYQHQVELDESGRLIRDYFEPEAQYEVRIALPNSDQLNEVPLPTGHFSNIGDTYNVTSPVENADPTATPTPAPTSTPTPVATATPTPVATATPTPQPVQEENDIVPSGSGVGSNGFVTGSHEVGVVSINASSGGDSWNVVVQNDAWNQVYFTITQDANGTYYLAPSYTSGNRYILNQQYFPDLWKNGQVYELTPARVNYLNSTWGLTIG